MRKTVAYLMVTLAFAASLVWVTTLNNRTNSLAHRADRLARENSKLLVEFERFRHIRSGQTTSADVKLCEAINTITRRDRETFIQSSKNSEKILRLLSLSAAQLRAIRAASKTNSQLELKRRPLVKCGQLPTVKSGAAPSKLPSP